MTPIVGGVRARDLQERIDGGLDGATFSREVVLQPSRRPGAVRLGKDENPQPGGRHMLHISAPLTKSVGVHFYADPRRPALRQFAFGLEKVLWMMLPPPAIGVNSTDPLFWTAKHLAASSPSATIKSIDGIWTRSRR